MSRLRQSIVDAARQAGVRAVRLDRAAAAVWDKAREPGDPVTYVGWYWHRVDRRGRVVAHDRSGPFPCESAAVADAFKVLQLSVERGRRVGRDVEGWGGGRRVADTSGRERPHGKIKLS